MQMALDSCWGLHIGCTVPYLSRPFAFSVTFWAEDTEDLKERIRTELDRDEMRWAEAERGAAFLVMCVILFSPHELREVKPVRSFLKTWLLHQNCSKKAEEIEETWLPLKPARLWVISSCCENHYIVVAEYGLVICEVRGANCSYLDGWALWISMGI
jgi:hypothetical protein